MFKLPKSSWAFFSLIKSDSTRVTDILIRQKAYPRWVTYLVRTWTLLGLFVNHWYIVSMIYYFIKEPKESQYLIGFFFLEITMAASIYKILYRRKNLSDLIQTICEYLRDLDRDRYGKCVKRFQILFGILILFLISQISIVTYLRLSRESSQLPWFKKMSFEAFNERPLSLNILAVIDGVAFVTFIIGLISVYNLVYCFLANAIAQSIHCLREKLTNDNDNDNDQNIRLDSFRREIYKIKTFIKLMNEELQYLVLMWLGVVFVLSCNGLLNMIIFPYDDVISGYNEFFNHFNLLLMLFLTSFVASKIEDERRNALYLLEGFSLNGINDESFEHLQNLYWQLNNNDILLKAGGCFTLTKQLFLSYVGFSVTYAVIFIQIHPQALSALQKMIFSKEKK